MDRDDPPSPTSQESVTFSFPALIERIRIALTLTAGDDSHRVDRAERLVELRQHVEQYLQDCQPLPARMQRQADEMRRHLAMMEALDRGTVVPSDSASLFHPLVEWLIRLNHEHAVKTAGKDAADAALRALVKSLTRKPKGRPTTFALSKIQRMKVLHDDGQSYGQIGRKLGISPQTVRATLDHHFPSQSTQKKPVE